MLLAVAAVRGIVDLLGAEAFAEVRRTLTVTVGMGHARLETSLMELEIDFPNPPASESLEFGADPVAVTCEGRPGDICPIWTAAATRAPTTGALPAHALEPTIVPPSLPAAGRLSRRRGRAAAGSERRDRLRGQV